MNHIEKIDSIPIRNASRVNTMNSYPQSSPRPNFIYSQLRQKNNEIKKLLPLYSAR